MAQKNTFNWNEITLSQDQHRSLAGCELVDETMRDGQQRTYGAMANERAKKQMLDSMVDVGISGVALGFPANARDHSLQLAKHMANNQNKFSSLEPYCLAHVNENAIDAIDRIVQSTGLDIEVMLFLASTELRRHIEGWDIAEMQKKVREVTKYARNKNLRVIFAAEDATRSDPLSLETLYKSSLDEGASRIAIPDTVGRIDPNGVINLMRYVRESIASGYGIDGIDWHGHNDLGHATSNALTAIKEGANRVHVTALGIGERAGNTPLETMAVNLTLAGNRRFNLKALPAYIHSVAQACDIEVPPNHPIVGESVFATQAGIHAAAISRELTNLGEDGASVYFAFDPKLVSREPQIFVGPDSSSVNVVYVLRALKVIGENEEPAKDLVDQILTLAGLARRTLTDDEIRKIAKMYKGASA